MLTQFIPMAITKVDDVEACVGALAQNGAWVRPEPVFLADVVAQDTPYGYFQWTTAELENSIAKDPRPEDRNLIRDGVNAPRAAEVLPADSRLDFLRAHLDSSVEEAFSGERSLGLIKASVHRVYAKPSTAGRLFFRTEFSDPAGKTYDWIIPEINFVKLVTPFLANGGIRPDFCAPLLSVFQSVQTFFTLGLTKPNNRFPGRFRGCHPLVVGIHSVPDYRDLSGRGVH